MFSDRIRSGHQSCYPFCQCHGFKLASLQITEFRLSAQPQKIWNNNGYHRLWKWEAIAQIRKIVGLWGREWPNGRKRKAEWTVKEIFVCHFLLGWHCSHNWMRMAEWRLEGDFQSILRSLNSLFWMSFTSFATPPLHVETFSWNLCATALWIKFQQALHRVTWSVSWNVFELPLRDKFHEK